MDKIKLSKNKKTKRVDIFINGKNLINILRKIEIPQIEKLGLNKPIRFPKRYKNFPPEIEKSFLQSNEMLKKYLKYLEKNRNPQDDPKGLAGSYIGLPPKEVFLPSKHFLGKQNKRYDRDGKTCILVCSCGDAGCWPMVTKITLTPKKIIWSNFKQAHSDEWKYNLKFNFDRKQYESELLEKV